MQGRKSRRRSPDDIEHLIRQHYAQGFRWFFVTDDNFARNKDWEAIFDRIIELREREGIAIKMVIQVDTLCHKIPNFVDKAARAGVRKVFLGLENINPANLLAAKKRQNKITEYRKMILAWKTAGVITYAGYILGFPADTPESIREDIEIIKKELPLDILEFFCLTPLPGSEDHKVLWQKGIAMDPDMNKYDLEHVVTGHAKMSKAAVGRIYDSAWKIFYTPEHIETILRRAAAFDIGVSHLASHVVHFSPSRSEIEQCIRCKAASSAGVTGATAAMACRSSRSGSFYPKRLWEIVVEERAAGRGRSTRSIACCAACARTRERHEYMDAALAPVVDDETETLELFTHNEGARNEVVRARKIAELTGGAGKSAAHAEL